MKTNKNYLLRTVADEYILMPTGEATADFNGMINLSEVAAFIWNNLDDSTDFDDLIKRIVSEYDIDAETARNDAEGFINALLEHNMATL